VALACRATLDAVWAGGHRAVFGGALLAEWRAHESRRGRTWRRRMMRCGRVVPWDGRTRLPARLATHARNEAERAAVAKDAHLLAAALAADSIVLSRDGNARTCFRRLAGPVAAIRPILWSDPGIAEEDVPAWIRRGAVDEDARCLGAPA
jgi:hypothetical protein